MKSQKLSWRQFKNGSRIVAGHLNKHRPLVLWLGFLSVISAAANAVAPYLLGRLFDALRLDAEPYLIFSFIISPFVFILSIWLLIRLISDIVQRYFTRGEQKLEELVAMNFVLQGAMKLLRLPMSFHKRHQMGSSMHKIERAANYLSNIVSQIIIALAPDLFSVFIAFGIVFFIDAALAAVLLGGLSIFILVIVLSTPRYQGLLDLMHKSYNRAWGSIYDSIMNVQAVKQATAEEYERRKNARNMIGRAVGSWIAYSKIYSNLSSAQRIIVTLTQFTLFAVSVFFIRSGRITLGELVAFNGYAAIMFGPFYRMGANWDRIQSGLIAIKRAQEILDLPEEVYTPKNSIVLTDMRGDVEFKSVSFRYGRNQDDVLSNVNFRVEPGETVALVGESGVGKSTLIDLIPLYFKPTKGKILIDGRDIVKIDLVSLRSFIAVVPQEPILFNDSVKNNIKYGSFGSDEQKVKEAARLAHADEFIEKFNKKYNQIVGERGIRLSAGQKQRIAIARAILRDPKILILDEPTSALDAKNEKLITEALDILMKERTTFIIAHRLSTARRADKILVLESGKIREEGRHEELIKIPGGVYRRLYELQIGLQ